VSKPQTRVIDGIEYTVAPIDPEDGLPVLLRMVKVIAAALGESFKGADSLSDFADMKLDSIDLGAAVKEFTNRIVEREVMADIKTLIDGRYCSWKVSGDGGTLDLKHFQGEYDRLFKVLAFVIEVNYGRFLSGLKAALKGAFQPGLAKGAKKKP
jgi:hypothetical protein